MKPLLTALAFADVVLSAAVRRIKLSGARDAAAAYRHHDGVMRGLQKAYGEIDKEKHPEEAARIYALGAVSAHRADRAAAVLDRISDSLPAPGPKRGNQ